METPSKALPSELDAAALIVCLAIEKGVDPYAWFLESENDLPDIDGVVVLRHTEFANRLSSLAFGVTVNESSKTMLEIERGLSETALKTISATCSYGDADAGIDVGLFLELCNARIEGGFVAKSLSLPLPSPTSQQETKRFFSDDKAFEAVLPSSPYDEEVLFDDLDSLTEEHVHGRAGAGGRGTRPYAYSHKKLTIRTNGSSSSSINNIIADSLNGNGSGTGIRLGSKGITKIRVATLAAPPSKPAPSKPSGVKPTAKNHASEKENSILLGAPDVVEDALRRMVKQPNLYHHVAVHLGWLVPSAPIPRGLIAHAGPVDDQWLPKEAIKMAFLQGRLRFNDMQMAVLVSIVSRFAKEKRQRVDSAPALHDSQARPGKQSLDLSVLSAITASGLPTGLHSAVAVGPIAAKKSGEKMKRAKRVLYKGNLNANWLRLYLQHLRLSRRQSSAVSEMQVLSPDTPVPFTSATLSAAKPAHARAPASTAADSVLLTKSTPFMLPKELRRALSGLPNSLGPEELKAVLLKNPILSEAQICLETRHRVTCWKSDQGGTNEFARALRIAQSLWVQSNGQDQWRRLQEDGRMELVAELEERVLKVKQEELLSAERVGGYITLDLFRKYEAFCRDTNYTETCSWREWVVWWQSDKEMKDREIDIVRIKRDAAARLTASMMKAANKPPPNPFAWHELVGTPKELLSSFDHSASKRLAQPLYKKFGASRVSTSPSDQIQVLPPPSPQVRCPSLGQTHGAELRQQLSIARQSLMFAGLGKDKELDTSAESAGAVKSPASKAVFKQWSAKKVAARKKAAALHERENEVQAAIDLKKASDAKKHFRTWCKLHAAGKYQIDVNGATIVKKVPAKSAMTHTADWGGAKSRRTGLERSPRASHHGSVSPTSCGAEDTAE